jgi:DNA-binding MarR family transcriptional regulator
MAVGRRVRVRVDSALAEHGLTYRHLSALGHLAGNADVSYAELARRGGVTTQSIQATLAQLQRRGAVVQRNTPKRGQRAQLGLTPMGTALLELGTGTMDDISQQLVATLPSNQEEPLGRALFALLSAMIRQDVALEPGPEDARTSGST